MKKENEIRALLKTIIDPELEVSIVDLGLVRRIELDAKQERANIELTLTNPGCPVANEMMQIVAYKTAQAGGIKHVDVNINLVPPWDPRIDATEEGKAELGIWE